MICASPSRIYELTEQGKIDFTLNSKETKSILPFVNVLEPAFSKEFVRMYTNTDMPESNKVAAVKGLQYLGQKEILKEKGYDVIDLPSGNTAIRVFLKKQSRHLLSFSSPMASYLKKTRNMIPAAVHLENLLAVQSNFMVLKSSPHNKEITSLLQRYANEFQIELYLDPHHSLYPALSSSKTTD